MPEEARISFTVRFDHPIVVWVLQLGGWLPLQFTTAAIVLVDKNVLLAAQAFEANPDRDDMPAERWWLSQLNSDRFVLNPVLCAHEGESRSVPTYSEFCDALARARQILAQALPKARLIEHPPSVLDRLFENVTATAERHTNEVRFLLEVAPHIANRVSSIRALQVERRIVAEASNCNLNLRTFVVLAALSCLYEPQDGSEPMIGRGVLKPHASYSAEDAHNAISDLRSLEILSLAAGMDGPSIGYCTRDKDLAAFWTYLHVSQPQWTGNTCSVSFSPGPELFPRLSQESVQSLLLRLQI